MAESYSARSGNDAHPRLMDLWASH